VLGGFLVGLGLGVVRVLVELVRDGVTAGLETVVAELVGGWLEWVLRRE
jgi:hypothetical protein